MNPNRERHAEAQRFADSLFNGSATDTTLRRRTMNPNRERHTEAQRNQRHAEAQRFADSLFNGSAAAIHQNDVQMLKDNVRSLGAQASDSLKFQVAELQNTFHVLQELKELKSRVAALEEENKTLKATIDNIVIRV